MVWRMPMDCARTPPASDPSGSAPQKSRWPAELTRPSRRSGVMAERVGFSTLSRVCGAFPAVSPADEAVDFVDGTSVAVGDDGHDIAPVAGGGGVIHQLVVDAGEKLEILGVIYEDLTGFADGPGEVLAVGVVERGLVDGVGAYAERQFAAAEEAQALHHAPIHAEHAVGGNTLQIAGEAEDSVGPVRVAAVAQDQAAILVGDQESGDHQDCQN